MFDRTEISKIIKAGLFCLSNMTKIDEILIKDSIVLLDGSIGTMLMERGADEPIIKANYDMPYTVFGLELEYFCSGADAVLTNSLTGSELMLKSLGLSYDAYTLNRRAAEIARSAAGDRKLVIGSVGPAGQLLEPYGPLTEKAAIASFVPQIRGLIEGGADAIVFETFMHLQELAAGVAALKEIGDVPFICSLTYESGRNGYATMMGDSPLDAIRFCHDNGALAAGANCGVGIDQMIKIMEVHRSIDPDILLWAKPNAGIPELVDNRLAYNETPEYFAKRLPELLSQEVSFVGGCCGTGPDHIAAMRDVIRERT